MYLDEGGVVALSRDFAKLHDLGDAAVSPNDPSKMIYYVAGWHQLHCLVNIPKSFWLVIRLSFR
jgi:hypothetical protein